MGQRFIRKGFVGELALGILSEYIKTHGSQNYQSTEAYTNWFLIKIAKWLGIC